MLLPLYNLHPSLPPRTLTDHSPSSFFTPKTLIFQRPKPSKSLIRSSITDNQILPKSAIRRIADKLRSLGITDENPTQTPKQPQNEPAGEIFIPLPKQLPKYRVGHTLDQSWSTPENPVPAPGSGNAITRYHELRSEVRKQKRLGKEYERREESVPTLAELSLSAKELRRLRTIGIELKKKLKIGKAGITEGIVNGIHERWRGSEVVRIQCEDLCRMNMKRTHDLLERKTGGLVVWRSGSKIILYRGANYKFPYFLSDKNSTHHTSPDALRDPHMGNGRLDKIESCSSGMDGGKPSEPSPTNKKAHPTLIQGVGSPNRVRFQLPGEAQLVEDADRLLEGLGPRFADWWGYDPLPVDADLLPAIVPGLRRPFRLLPYGVKPKLTDDEMTTLRRLGRPLPCHFALGRNRKLQGLAASIVKLWEKCEIAKIAVKRGVQNTNSELMAEELKWLTGGTLLSRDREFITLYRGKDFLPSAVSSAIEERRKHGLDEENQRTMCSTSVITSQELRVGSAEHVSGDNRECGSEDEVGETNDQNNAFLFEQKRLKSSEAAIKRTSIKISMALEKKAKAEKLLAELEKEEIPQQPELDKEGITEEERYMLRKVGLRMKPFLLLGRRGVFDGTVENMHLHWKYRELVKIISNERSIEAVNQVARTLEAESGGILVTVERVSKGYAIIMYRGKNYKRPAFLRPRTLLNKREAMKRSLEAQRRQSLKLHVLKLTRNIDDLQLQLVKDNEANSKQSVDESRLPSVKEETGTMQSDESIRSDIELISGHQSHLGNPASYEENAEDRDKHRADSTSMNYINDAIATIDSLQATQQDGLLDFSTYDGNGTGEAHSIAFKVRNDEGRAIDSTTCPDNFMLKGMGCSTVVHMEQCVSDNEAMESSDESSKNEPQPSIPIVLENKLNEMSFRDLHLSNRDRLLLRKQALNMKKRPVLAVGRSNVVSGVAKAIKAHFEKHPLAIVNVKGRAKGTSIQEMVLKLQEATGAVLVSQEPSKVILYRGWGAGDEPFNSSKTNARYAGKTSVSRDGGARPAVSPELIAAIRLECGLHGHQEEEATR